ncbi:hypothetical protein KC19_12G011300, partial [Ceratodon purpureus]
VLRVRHSPQPVPLPDPGPNSWVRGVRGGCCCGVACWSVRVLLPSPQGTPHHGAPCRCGVPPRLCVPASLSCQALMVSLHVAYNISDCIEHLDSFPNWEIKSWI